MALWWATLDRSVLYPSVATFRTKLTENMSTHNEKDPEVFTVLVVDCQKVARLDYTAAEGIQVANVFFYE